MKVRFQCCRWMEKASHRKAPLASGSISLWLDTQNELISSLQAIA